MGGRNMAGLTERDIRERADERAAGCLAAAACGAGMALLVLAWLVWLACARWPVLCERLPALGFVLLGVGLANACRAGRKEANHGG